MSRPHRSIQLRAVKNCGLAAGIDPACAGAPKRPSASPWIALANADRQLRAAQCCPAPDHRVRAARLDGNVHPQSKRQIPIAPALTASQTSRDFVPGRFSGVGQSRAAPTSCRRTRNLHHRRHCAGVQQMRCIECRLTSHQCVRRNICPRDLRGAGMSARTPRSLPFLFSLRARSSRGTFF